LTTGVTGTFGVAFFFSGAGISTESVPCAGRDTRLTATADGMYLLDGANAGIIRNTANKTLWSSSEHTT
jgi:hypothetical protein